MMNNRPNSVTLRLNFSNEEAAALAYNSLAKLAAGIFKSPACEETDIRLRTESWPEYRGGERRNLHSEDEEAHLRFQSEHDFPEPSAWAGATGSPGPGCECEDCGGDEHPITCLKCQCERCGGTAPAFLHTDPPEVMSNEACPGCGSTPGDGPGKGCDDPDGCGFWKEAGA